MQKKKKKQIDRWMTIRKKFQKRFPNVHQISRNLPSLFLNLLLCKSDFQLFFMSSTKRRRTAFIIIIIIIIMVMQILPLQTSSNAIRRPS